MMICVFVSNTAASGESVRAATYKTVTANPSVIVRSAPSKSSS